MKRWIRSIKKFMIVISSEVFGQLISCVPEFTEWVAAHAYMDQCSISMNISLTQYQF